MLLRASVASLGGATGLRPSLAAAPTAAAAAFRPASPIAGSRPGLQGQGQARAFGKLATDRIAAGHERQYFGMEWFKGRKPTQINGQMIELPPKEREPMPAELEFRKYPAVASGLGAEYYYRDGQKSPVSYYHIRSKTMGDSVCVGATDQRYAEARTIDNYVKQQTRGFALQLLLDGRGVKAYWEPKSPHLMVRLGVGAKVRDLTEYVKRDPDIEVTVNKKGDVVVLHGPNKARVGTLGYRLLKKMQPVLLPYTGNGAHFAFHPNIRKVVRKK